MNRHVSTMNPSPLRGGVVVGSCGMVGSIYASAMNRQQAMNSA